MSGILNIKGLCKELNKQVSESEMPSRSNQ